MYSGLPKRRRKQSPLESMSLVLSVRYVSARANGMIIYPITLHTLSYSHHLCKLACCASKQSRADVDSNAGSAFFPR